MRHVDEGAIHAWLDGQITDRAEAAWIDEHLRWCATCAARAAEERGLLEQAHALLASAAPAADVPAFDEIAVRAAAVDGPQADDAGVAPFARQRRLLQLGWAASLVLAAGIGWLARDIAPALETTRVAEAPGVAVADAPAAGGTPAPAVVSNGPAPQEGSPLAAAAAVDSERAQGELPPAADSTRQGASGRAQRRDARGQTAVAAAPAEARQRSAAAAAPPPPAAALDERGIRPEAAPDAGADAARAAAAALAARQAFVTPLPEAVRQAPVTLTEPLPVTTAPAVQTGATPPRAVRPPAAAAPAAPTPAPASRATFATAGGWRALPRTEAAARSGMALYGLEGLEAVLTTISPDNTAVRTFYRLESGGTIELLQERASATPTAAAPESLARAVAAERSGVAANLAAPPPRTWSEIRGDVRLSLQTSSFSQDVNALAGRLRVE